MNNIIKNTTGVAAMNRTRNSLKNSSRFVLSALVALSVTALSAHAATVTWDNNGGVGDNEWGTDTNWDPATGPAASDIVIIDNGNTVNITGNALNDDGSNLDVRVSGSALTFTGGGSSVQFNMNSASISLDGTSSFNGGGEFVRVFSGAGFVFDDGATVSGISTMELNNGGGSFTFNLGASGFTTVNGGDTLGVSGTLATAIGASDFVVDFANYTGGAETFTLIDWNNAPGLLDDTMLQTANISFLNTSGYGEIALTWDDTNKAIELSFGTVAPEPSALALLGIGGAMLLANRRRTSLCKKVMQ